MYSVSVLLGSKGKFRFNSNGLPKLSFRFLLVDMTIVTAILQLSNPATPQRPTLNLELSKEQTGGSGPWVIGSKRVHDSSDETWGRL